MPPDVRLNVSPETDLLGPGSGRHFVGHLNPCQARFHVMQPVHRKAHGKPVEESAVVVVRAALRSARRITLVGIDGKAAPQQHRVQDQRRYQPGHDALDADNGGDRTVDGGVGGVGRDVLEQIAPRHTSVSQQPEYPVVRQGERPKRNLPGSVRVEKFVGIPLRNVGRRVVLEVGFTEGHERDRRRDHCNSSPPQVCGAGTAEVSVRRLVRYGSGDEAGVGSNQDIDHELDSARRLPEVSRQCREDCNQ